MRVTIKRVVLWLLFIILAVFGAMVAKNWNIIQRVFLGGVHVYETTPPALPAEIKRPAILVFSKTNAFRHEEAIPAGKRMFEAAAKEKGWGYFETENGAVFSPAILARFDAVVFNNTSGDVFTPAQRDAFKAYLEGGGGYLGLHAAGDNSHKAWDWYMQQLLGATFTQHTMSPQFQTATVNVENKTHPATAGLPASWRHLEEWYSFDRSPRKSGADVLLAVDEKTYKPVGMFGKDLAMGDHPAAWSRCIGKGRVFYTIFGHRAEAFAEPEVHTLLVNALGWVTRQQGSECDAAPAAEKKP